VPPEPQIARPPEAQVLQTARAHKPKSYTADPKKVARQAGSEIDAVIQSGKYSQLPPAEVVSRSDGSDPPRLSLLNETGYTLTVTFYGSVERSVKVADGKSLEMELPPGAYRVLGRASVPTVVPFVGNDNYSEGASFKPTHYRVGLLDALHLAAAHLSCGRVHHDRETEQGDPLVLAGEGRLSVRLAV